MYSDTSKVENIEGEGEKAGCQHFVPLPDSLQKASISGSQGPMTIWQRVEFRLIIKWSDGYM